MRQPFYNVEHRSAIPTDDPIRRSRNKHLKALATGPGRLGVSELSDRLGLAKGTVHGLLRTLAAHGLVEQHPDSDRYLAHNSSSSPTATSI